jgi:predicted RNA-binding Zn-ribbon protein involved in translation (DUF1610 family)
VFTGWAVLAGAYPAVILAIIVVELFGAPWLMRLVHANVFDVLGGEPVEELFDVVVGVGLASALTWAGVYGSRKAVSVRALQAALSARPPARPGGPAECRSCGAPLHVRPEDEAVRCPYCGTESLVRIAWSWIRKVQKNVEAVGASLASVRPAVEKNARDFRRALWLYGVGLVLLGALLIGGTISDLTPQWASRLDSFPPGWRLHVEAKPRVAFFETFQRSAIGRSAIVTWFTAPKLVPVGRPIPLTMTPPACDQSGCTADVLVALRHGERLRITTDATAASLFARIDRHVASGFAHDEFEPRGREMPLDARRPIAFTAGWDAWYRIDFRAPGARAGSSWPVSLSLP